MRIGIIGASHWHVSIYYLPVLEKMEEVEIVGLADPDPSVLERRDPQAKYRHFTNYRDLLEQHAPDLVFAHAPHHEMTALAADLVRRGQPFHIEKPAGIDWRELAPVADTARSQGLFNSVALVNRYMPVVEELCALRDSGRLGQPVHMYYRLFAGPPGRYRDWGVDWMLDPARGGGPLFNFGAHGIDLFLHLTGQSVVEVSCWQTHALHYEAIEDLASLRMQGASGALGVVEVGYVLPGAYERYFSLTATRVHVGGQLEAGKILLQDGEPIEYGGLSADASYEVYTRDVVRRAAEGRPAKADLGDMVAALRVLNAGVEAMRTGETVTVWDSARGR